MAKQNITQRVHEESLIFRYLCPSLLSRQEILEELKISCAKLRGLDKKTREELTDIFIRYVMPLPQRIFPNNHHGKIINKMILKENTWSRKSGKFEEKKSCLQFGFGDGKQGSNSSSPLKSPVSIGGDRLKPPVDSSDLHSKKISLSRAPCSSSSSSLGKIVIKNRSRERSESSSSESGRQMSSDGAVDSKKVELKRTHSTSEKTDNESPVKKARQKIAWP